MGNLHHQLSGTNGCYDVLTEGFCLNGIGELLGSLVVNVGFKQRFADVLDGFRDVDFGDTSFTLEDLKGPF